MNKKSFEVIYKYLSHNTSKIKVIFSTLFMILMYLMFYIIAKKSYYSLIKIDSYFFIIEDFFTVFFLISTLPIFFFIFFKLNTYSKLWSNTEKPHLIDYFFWNYLLISFSFL